MIMTVKNPVTHKRSKSQLYNFLTNWESFLIENFAPQFLTPVLKAIIRRLKSTRIMLKWKENLWEMMLKDQLMNLLIRRSSSTCTLMII
jgi:hypothetical protein